MGENIFHEGQDNIRSICYPDDSEIISGKNGVEKITVSMESGQMALIPWFCIWREGKIDSKHNGALIANVYFNA